MESKSFQKFVIVGAGPVGMLAALYAANRGLDVEIYELRDDFRKAEVTPLNFTKSINITLAERGMQSLSSSGYPGLLSDVLRHAVPAYTREVYYQDWNGNSRVKSFNYDVHGNALQVCARSDINKEFLKKLELLPNVKIFFKRKLVRVDFQKKIAVFEQRLDKNAGTEKTDAKDPWAADRFQVDFDFLLGADGAHSATRYQLSKAVNISISRTWLDMCWCELSISPDKFGRQRLGLNSLHIWPAKDYMFVALPDLSGTFTCNFFAISGIFHQFEDNPEAIIPFFKANLPDVLDLIGEDKIVQQFQSTPHQNLLDIRCSPYNYGNICAIVGDAAHAMVPFYGQGMNTGFEDVKLLFECLDDNMFRRSSFSVFPPNESKFLDRFSEFRKPDVHAVTQLAFEHYTAIRSGVSSPLYRLQTWVENALQRHIPSMGWVPLYSRVTFSCQRFSEAKNAVARQKMIVTWSFGCLMLFIMLFLWHFVSQTVAKRFLLA